MKPRVMKGAARIILSQDTRRTSLLGTFSKLRENPNRVLLLDGGTGEELFRRNVPDDRKIWSATALVHPEYHEILEQVHTSFLESGSNLITTNSYGVVPGVGFSEDEVTSYIDVAGAIARQSVSKFTMTKQRAKDSSPAYVLGSLGPLVESYRPDLILPLEEGSRCYKRACQALFPHVDAFLGETLSCVAESLQVLHAVGALDSSERLPLLLSFSLTPRGNFRDGQDLLQGIRQWIDEWKTNYSQVDVLAILFNCCEPEAITLALERLHADHGLKSQLQEHGILVGAYANRLTTIDPNWSLQESESPQAMRQDLDETQYWDDFVSRWTGELGVQLVGGCCGIRPTHIERIKRELIKQEKMEP